MTNIESLISDIQGAESKGPLYKNELLTGFSGESLYGTLQRLARHLVDTDQCYLEVGVFQGMTLLSVAGSLESGLAYGIDNFAFFDPDQKNQGIVRERMEKLGIDNAVLIDQDYEDALEKLDRERERFPLTERPLMEAYRDIASRLGEPRCAAQRLSTSKSEPHS